MSRQKADTTYVINLAEQKRAARAYLEAARKADSFLARYATRIPGALHAAGIREVLIHFAGKEAEGRRVIFALADETVPRAHSEFELVTSLLEELPKEGIQ